jgi:hypothetical protein
MKKIIALSYIIFFLFMQQVLLADEGSNFWKYYQDILRGAVTTHPFVSIDGKFDHASVDYEKIKNSPELQQKVKRQLERLKKAVVPEAKKYKLAFLINAYNFFTIVDVVNNYPISSMKKIGWKNKHHEIGGKYYSLNDIEHNNIRPLSGMRIHFAINCAAVGCPSLSSTIFDGNHIDRQLDNAVTNALKNPLHLRRVSKDKVNTTQIFKWFSKDFESGGYVGVADFVNRFAPERLRNAHQIEKVIKYDWNLNTEQNVLKKMKELGTEFPELKLKKK